MIMDDLLCTEESVAPLQDEASALLLLLPPPPPAIDTAEVLDMMLQQEARKGRVQRNAQYLTDVQRHGMEATWRRKICHWMFEVRLMLVRLLSLICFRTHLLSLYLSLLLPTQQTGKAFELAKDTVGCAIHFMDQFLSVSSVDKIMLQLLSMVCMYVASKMHESQPISMVRPSHWLLGPSQHDGLNLVFAFLISAVLGFLVPGRDGPALATQVLA